MGAGLRLMPYSCLPLSLWLPTARAGAADGGLYPYALPPPPPTPTLLHSRMPSGKTTLMDCLALRKTGGKITGDVRVNGFPQKAATFMRIMG